MGEYYVDYDQDSVCWGVFHREKGGFCFALFANREEAEEHAMNLNGDFIGA